MIERQARIALLIDADNSPASKIDVILAELAKVGVTNIRRAYGNWKKDGLKGWEAVLHEYAIRPVQQFDYSKGKNATDMVMVIEAMDLLYTDRPDAFGIVSSDADFTPLVMHLKAKGALVYGFGAKKTPLPFVNACSRFLYLENLGQPEPVKSTAKPKAVAKGEGDAAPTRLDTAALKQDARLVSLLRNAVESAAGAGRGGPADRQPGLLRPAQLRLPQAAGPDRGDAAVRSGPPRHAVRAARQAPGQAGAQITYNSRAVLAQVAGAGL